MAKPKKSRSESGDGASHNPFAALSGMRASLPKRAPSKLAAKAATMPTPSRSAARARPAARSSASPASSSSTDSAGYSREDRVAFGQAFAGVKPLGGQAPRRKQAAPEPPAVARKAQADADARERLDALVGGGVHFALRRESGRVEGLRQGVHASHLEALLDSDVTPDLELDLHGLVVQDAKLRLSRFVREAHGRGARTLLIIHGKGLGSVGAPVLGEAALDALTRGGAAALVLALITAPRRLGGDGALLVRLGQR